MWVGFCLRGGDGWGARGVGEAGTGLGAGGGEIPAAGRGYDGGVGAGVTEEWRGCDGALLRGSGGSGARG